MKLKETKVYSINDFISWYNNGELELSPKYQRENVWNSSAESYLIDTIVRGLPVPQIFMRQTIDPLLRKTHREIIDGQQRLRTIIKFYQNEISINRIHNANYGGKYYSQLPEEVQLDFLHFQLPVEVIVSKDDNVIYDLFMRVNTNSYTLNKQELRNAKFWGDFKVITYEITRNYREFLKSANTFNTRDFLRMKDAEFISYLMNLYLNGIQTDTPARLDNVYKKHENIEETVVEEIQLFFENSLKNFETIFDDLHNYKYFSKHNYLYTLFAIMLINEYISPIINRFKNVNLDIDYNTLKKQIIAIEEKITAAIENDSSDSSYFRFHHLHSARTTNATEREERINLMLRFLNDRE